MTARKVLLTTGLTDEVPQIEGIEQLYGRSVHHCPYCDGFEHRDQPLAVYGAGDKGAGLALMMKHAEKQNRTCRFLAEALNDEHTRLEAAECIRELIEEIRLVPVNGKLRVELYGELAALLNLAALKRPR